MAELTLYSASYEHIRWKASVKKRKKKIFKIKEFLNNKNNLINKTNLQRTLFATAGIYSS